MKKGIGCKAAAKKSRTDRSPWYRWYYKPRWKALRAAQLHSEPLCVRCGEVAVICDHRVPHKGDESLFYNPSNLDSMCKRCHDSKTAREDSSFAKGGKDYLLGRCDEDGQPVDPMHPWNR